MEDILDVSKNIQSALSEFASGPMSEVKDLTKQVRDNFLEANSAANIEITGEDKLAKMVGQLTGIKTGYEAVDSTLRELHMNLNGIADKSDLWVEASLQQESIQQRIEKMKGDEAKLTNDIAEQQRVVLMAEQARAAVPFESDEYKEYTEQIKEANRGIIEQQGHITGLQAQQAGLKSIQDGYLETLIKEAEGGKTINEITATRRKLYLKNLELSSAQLDLIEQQQTEIQRLGPGMDDYIKKWGASNDAVMHSFDSIAGGISDTLGSLPLVGGLLKSQVEGPLKEAAEESKKSWQGFTEGMQASMAEGDSFATAFKKNFSQLGGAIGGMGKAIMSALFNPFTLVLGLVGAFVFLLKAGFEELSRLENIARDFRFQFGDSAVAAERLVKDAIELEKSFKNLGLYADDFLKATSALRNVFASTDFISKETVKFIGLVSMATGISEESAAGALNTLMKLGMTARGQAEGTIMSIQKMSAGYGVAFSEVMDDIANASEDAMLFAQGSAKALALGAVQAKKLGSSLEDAAASASALLDFESSVPAQMKASVLLGKQLDFSTMRRMAWTGDTKGLLEEQNKMLKEAGGLSKLNRIQEQGLADAMGVSVDRLYEMEKTMKQNEGIRKLAAAGNLDAKAQVAKWDAAELEAARLKNRSAKELAADNEKELKILIKQNRERESINAITNEFKSLWHDIKTALAPVVEALLPRIREIIEEITGTMSGFTTEVEEGGKTTIKLTDRGKELKETLEGVLDTVKTLGGMLVWAFENPWTALIAFGSALIGIKITMGLIGGLASGIFSGGGGKGGGIFGSIAKAINKIKPSKLFAVSGAIFILSGAMYVAAKAFQEFAKVDWPKTWPGLAVLAALALTAKAMSKGSKSMIKGALAIGVLSIALIPLAFALNMMKDVGLETVFVVAGALIALGVAANVLGGIMSSGVGAAAILLGAVAIAALGASLIPLAYALNLATPGIEAFGTIVRAVFDGLASVITAIGTVIVGVVTAIGNAISGIIDSVSGAISSMVQDISTLSEVNPLQLLAVAGAIGAVGLAMASFGVAGGIGAAASGAGNALGAMGNAVAGVFGADTKELNKSPLQKILDFAKESDSIIQVADKMDLMITSFEKLSTMDEIFEKVATGLQSMGSAFTSFGLGLASIGTGNAIGSIGNAISSFFGGGEAEQTDPLDQLVGFLQRLSGLQIDTESLKVLSELNIGGFIGTLPDEFEEKIQVLATGFNQLFTMFAGLDAKAITDIEQLSTSMPRFLSGLAKSLPKLSTTDIRGLEKLAGGLDDFFTPIGDISFSKLRELPSVGSAIGSLVKGLAGVGELPNNTSQLLTQLGGGLEGFFNGFEDIDFDVIKEVPKVSASLLPTVKSFATVEFAGLLGSKEALIELGAGLDQLADYLDDGEIETLASLVTLKPSVDMLVSLSDISFENITTGVQALATSIQTLVGSLNNLNVDKIKELKNVVIPGAQGPVGSPGVEAPSGEEWIEMKPKLMMAKIADLPVVDVAGSSLPASDPFATPGPSLAEVFSTPLAETQVQQVTDTGTTSLSEVFAEPVVIEKQVKETGISSIGSYEVFSENLIKEMGELSLDQYTEKIQSYVENNNQLIKLGIEGRTELDINKFAAENKHMNKMLHEIESEKSYEADNAKMIKTSQIHGELSSLGDIKNTISKPGGNHLQYHDYAKISSTLGINAQAKEREMYTNDKSGIMTHEVFKNEILKLISERETELINIDLNSTQNLPDQIQTNFEMMDSTSTQPMSPSLDSITQTTLQETATAPTSILTKIVDFTTKLIPQVPVLPELGAEQEQSVTSSEVDGFETINIQGKTVFVEEITKVTQSGTEIQSLENRPNNREVVTKLDELIKLMRTGGIAVNMDGRKVSRRVAASQE